MAIFLKTALIISTGEKNTSYLSDVITMAQYDNIRTVSSAGEARRILIESDYDLCLVNAPLPDESGQKLAETIAEKSLSTVILIVKNEYYDEISSKVENFGVITISKPLNKSILWNAVKFASAAQNKLQRIQSENEKLQKKIEDIKIIDRAKCLLISYLSMDEEDAHKYIEKQAMDERITKRAVADKILATYDN